MICLNCGGINASELAGRPLCPACRNLLKHRGYLLPQAQSGPIERFPVHWLQGGRWREKMVSEEYLVSYQPEEIRRALG